MDDTTRARLLAAALVVLSAISFSTKAIFVKLAFRHGVDAVTLLALRMLFAAPLFAAIALWALHGLGESGRIHRSDFLRILALGIGGYYLASLFDFLGLQYITAALERLILFLHPTMVVILSALFFGYRISRRDVAALLFCYIGIAVSLSHDLEMSATASTDVLLGGFWVLLSAFCYALYLIGNGEVGRRVGSVRLACYASLASTVFIVGHFLAVRPVERLLGWPAEVYGLALGMAGLATALPIVLMSIGIRRIGASSASMLGAVGPVATIFLGALFLDEPLSVWQLVGAALVLTGVLLIGLQRDRE